MQAKFESETQEVAGSQFSVSQQESSAKTALLENALDIKVISIEQCFILSYIAVHILRG